MRMRMIPLKFSDASQIYPQPPGPFFIFVPRLVYRLETTAPAIKALFDVLAAGRPDSIGHLLQQREITSTRVKVLK